MIDFDDIDENILNKPTEKQIAILENNNCLDSEVYLKDLKDLIKKSESFEVSCKSSANNGLSMSLQARKIRNSLEKSRVEILKPHQTFIKSVNKQAKEYEAKLLEIETNLSNKILLWLDNQNEQETETMIVDDGTLTKKSKSYFEIIDENLIPREFLMIDENKIKEAIKNGIESIEGIKIYKKNEVDLRVKNSLL